jgi:hypothetical protein
MIFASFYDVQQVMLRACVQNVMLVATLPFYLAQEGRPATARSRHTGQTSSVPRHSQAPAGGPGRQPGTEDIRWLR